jgi:hypothetical protein
VVFAAVALLIALLAVLWFSPRTDSLAEEERKLRAYFRRVDQLESGALSVTRLDGTQGDRSGR